MNVRKCIILGFSLLIVTNSYSTPEIQLITSKRRAFNIPTERTITVHPGQKGHLLSLSYNPTLTPGGQADSLLIIQGSYPIENRSWLSSRKINRKTKSKKNHWLKEDLVLGRANSPVEYTLSIPKDAPEGTFSIIGAFDEFQNMKFKNMGTIFVVHVVDKKKHE